MSKLVLRSPPARRWPPRRRPPLRSVLPLLSVLSLLACSGAGGAGRDAARLPCDERSAAAKAPEGCALVCRAEIPIVFAGNTPLATVWVNDQPLQMIFDTGASTSVLSTDAAARLGLEHATPAAGRIIGIGGEQPRATVVLRSLAVSYLRRTALTVPVAVMGRPKGVVPPDGVLGNDILRDYEVDLDMPHRLVRLYQGRLCQGLPPGWTEEDASLPFDPTRRGSHVVVPVALDGKPTAGLIDSGADVVVVSRAFALAAGVPASELSSDLDTKLFGLGPRQVPGGLHRFDSLTIGSERLAPVETAVIDPPFGLPGVVLGEDYLQSHKVWISYATGRVHFAQRW